MVLLGVKGLTLFSIFFSNVKIEEIFENEKEFIKYYCKKLNSS